MTKSDTVRRTPGRPGVAFVLVEPRYEGNVGASARALKNNGFSDLRLVRPPDLSGDARAMAWKSLDVLNRARRYERMDDAIADATLVCAFTARGRRDTRDVLTLEEAAPRILAEADRGRVALLFGREDRGLTREEMAPSAFLVSISAARERQVYNLSQAVLLAAYILRAAGSGTRRPTFESGYDGTPTTAGDRRHLSDRIRALLVTLGYREHKDQGLLERIVTRGERLIDRAAIDQADHAMILGVLKRIDRLADRAAARDEEGR